jgi:sporulation protein YlmC with PRC-barrel domain
MVTKEKCCLPRFLQMGMIALMCSIFSSIPAMAADAKGIKPENPSQAEQTNPQEMRRASQMVDHAVYNQRGEELGEVDDLIMSRNGKIKKVILLIGEFLQTGKRLVAVPFESLKGSDEGHIVYNATKEQLKRDPRFSYRTEGLYGRPFYPFPPLWSGIGVSSPVSSP